MEATPRELILYETEHGRCPFVDWLDSLRDIRARARIKKRLDRVELGNLGDVRSVGEGVSEILDRFPMEARCQLLGVITPT